MNPARIAWSADSNYLVIVDRAGPNEAFGLFSLAIDSGEKGRLTTAPDALLMDSGPAISPDGGFVAFTRSSGNIGVGDLYLLQIAAGMKPVDTPKRLTFDNRQNGHPAWTADGRSIVFSSPGMSGTFGLWRIPAAGGAQRQRLPSVGEDGLYPAIARQGKRMIYTKYGLDSNIWRVEIKPVSGGAPESPGIPLVASTRQDVMPRLSPDGHKLAFASDRAGYYQIWLCDSDGSNAVQLTFLDGVSLWPSWSPDGQVIAFQSNAAGVTDIYIVNSGGGRPRRLSKTGGSTPTFSHDGTWVYFTSIRNGRAEVWKVPSQGGDQIQVTKDGGELPIESPDGKYLYYMRRATTGPLYRVPAAGGAESQVLEEMAARGYAVTKDGIYFIAPAKSATMNEYYEVNANHNLQFFSFRTGNSRVVTQLRKPLQLGVTVSPDNRWILYSQIDQHVEDLMLVEGFH